MANLISIVTTPATGTIDEPVKLDQLNEWLGQPENDLEVQLVLEGVIEEAEQWTRRTLRSTVTRTSLYQHWQHIFKFEFPPLQSITSVQYFDSTDVLTSVLSSDYNVVTPTDGVGRLEFVDNFNFPILTDTRSDRIEIVSVTGWGSLAAIPARAKLAIMHLTKYHFDGGVDRFTYETATQLLDSLEFGFLG